MAETMDRGSDILRNKLQSCNKLEVRQGRRGWLQECLCCVTKSDFKYLDGDKQIARSKEEFSFLCRCCLAPDHAFDMTIKEPDAESETELLEINRPVPNLPSSV